MPLLARSASSWSESTAVTPCWSRSHAASSGSGYSPTRSTGRMTLTPGRPPGAAGGPSGRSCAGDPSIDTPPTTACARAPRGDKEGGVFTLALSDEERLIQDTARRFARDRLLPGLRAHERARGVPRELVGEFAALGLTAGEDLGAFARVLVLEELAAVDPGAALALDAGGLAQPLLDAAGLGAALGRGVVIEDVEGRFHARDGRRLAGEHPWVPADEIAVAAVLP